ncbi:Otoferlin [Manis pentadactyla]|nr:Otoferlin [Manis pentadactyla]
MLATAKACSSLGEWGRQTNAQEVEVAFRSNEQTESTLEQGKQVNEEPEEEREKDSTKTGGPTSRFPCPDAAQNTLSSSHGAAIGFALAKEVEVSLSSGSSFKDMTEKGRRTNLGASASLLPLASLLELDQPSSDPVSERLCPITGPNSSATHMENHCTSSEDSPIHEHQMRFTEAGPSNGKCAAGTQGTSAFGFFMLLLKSDTSSRLSVFTLSVFPQRPHF